MKKNILLSIVIAFQLSSISAADGSEVDHNEIWANEWSICQELYNYILATLPRGSTILELGSGWGSSKLSMHYEVWSVEHDIDWLGRYKTHYIYAPIVNGWYSIEHLKNQLPRYYDLLLVDGPPEDLGGRSKFFDNLALFNTHIPIIFDDVNRKAEYELMVDVANHLQRKIEIYACGDKKFGRSLFNKVDLK